MNRKQYAESTIALYSKVQNIDKAKALELFNNLCNYYGAKKEKRISTSPMLPLEDRWYKSLETSPDYGVYEDEYYFVDLMACYWIFSRGYVVNLGKKVFDNRTKSLSEKFEVSSMIDIGCGLGDTTNDFKKIFPNATIYATNLPSPQLEYCKQNIDAKILTDIPSIHIDLVFASEFFEHLKYPISYLDKVIRVNTPNVLILANSFNTKSIGHFKEYEGIDQKFISRAFNWRLRELGYIKMKTAIWNDKPSVWVKNTQSM